MARFYGAACLSVDAVVTDVLINGNSPVGLRARQLYDSAAALYAQKKPEEAGKYNIYSCRLGYAFTLTAI